MASKPPMCPGTWLLGNARALLDDTAGALTDGYQRCGPVFRVRAAWRRYTIVAGPAVNAFMASGLDQAHLSRERLFGAVAREFGRADLILKEIGSRHARLRPPLAVAYSRQVASPHVPAMIDAVRREARAWPSRTPLGVVRSTKALAFRLYCTLLGTEALAFRDCLLMTTYLMNVAARLLPSVVLRTPWYRRAHARTYGAITDLVQRRRWPGAPADGAPTLVDALARVRDPNGMPLTDDEVVSYAAYGIGASIGYVGRLTAFMLYEILRDQTLQSALEAEADAAFADGVRDAAGVRRLRLLRSVYDETLRLHSLALGMPFDVASDFEFRGYAMRRGEYLVVSPVPSSYAPEHFPDPHRFDPARCRAPRNEHRKPGVCQPFGAGDRTCAAMGLVELMSMTLVATVLHERALTLYPRTYRLRRSVFPLPSPDWRCRLQAGDRLPRSVTGAAAPIAEEDVVAAFPGHDEPVVRQAIANAVRRCYEPGHVIVREGDAADAFYLIEKGQVVVTRASVAEPLATLSDGEWFGETGVLLQAPRNATVTAGPNGTTARVLAGDAFLAMVAASDLVASEIGQLLRKRAASARLLDVAPLLSQGLASRLLPEFERRTYPAGARIIEQGDPAEEFFVMVSGEALVSRRTAEGVDQALATLSAGEYFGEMGLLHAAPRNATVTAGRGPVTTLVTGRAGFDRLLAESGGRRGELAMAMLSRVERMAD